MCFESGYIMGTMVTTSIQKNRITDREIHDREFQNEVNKQITKLCDQNGHDHRDTNTTTITTSCTPSPSVGTKSKVTVLEDNGEQ